MSNYPAGVTDAMIDELVGYDVPEPTDEEIEAAYLDRLEAEAAMLPPYDFTAEAAGALEWSDEDIAEYEAWMSARGWNLQRRAA
jgi:hypothetical protein